MSVSSKKIWDFTSSKTVLNHIILINLLPYNLLPYNIKESNRADKTLYFLTGRNNKQAN